MSEQLFEIALDDGELVDIDIDQWGNYVGITDRQQVLTLSSSFYIYNKIKFALVRYLTDILLLVVSRRTVKGDNAFIYNLEGELLKTFFAGDGVEDVIVVADKIIFSYFDEGVFGNPGPNNEGIAIFDFNGQFLYGFNSANQDMIVDCYAMCKYDNDKILFYIYPDFPLVELNINTFKAIIYKTSDKFVGAHAMSAYQGQALFYGGYNKNQKFYLWNIWQQQAILIGEYSGGRIRGIGDGKFISVEKNGFKIINPLD
ncbi:MAG: hypothetical protein QM660_06615 [Dysgonomonas sp.]